MVVSHVTTETSFLTQIISSPAIFKRTFWERKYWRTLNLAKKKQYGRTTFGTGQMGRIRNAVHISFQHRRLEDGYLVFRPSLKLRNRTRLRLFSSSFLAWNSPWILKPRCTMKAELRTENLYPATKSSQLWERERGGWRRQIKRKELFVFKYVIRIASEA